MNRKNGNETTRYNKQEFLGSNFNVTYVQILDQRWTNRSHYTGYLDSPRPHSGFILIVSDIKIRFRKKDGETLTASRGDLVYIPKGCFYFTSFHCIPTDGKTHNFTIHFDLQSETGEDVLFADSPVILTNDKSTEIQTATKDLCRTFHSADIFYDGLKIRAKFFTLLDRIVTTLRNSYTYAPIRKGILALEREWDKNYPIEKYARLCNLSESYFYILFKQGVGISPVQYRNGIRLSNAKSLLLNTALPVVKIAESVGFDDPFYFSTFFKRHTGCSPKKYRETETKI